MRTRYAREGWGRKRDSKGKKGERRALQRANSMVKLLDLSASTTMAAPSAFRGLPAWGVPARGCAFSLVGFGEGRGEEKVCANLLCEAGGQTEREVERVNGKRPTAQRQGLQAVSANNVLQELDTGAIQATICKPNHQWKRRGSQRGDR